MEKEHAIFERLERIDGLRREDASPGVLLDEVRGLLAEAEEWVRTEPELPSSTIEAVERSRAALEAREPAADLLATR